MGVEQLDLLIVGAGPAGLSAADAARGEGLNYLVVERGLIADTVFHYPVGRTVFSTVDELEMEPGALRPCREKPTREELLSHYVRFALEGDLRINTEEEAVGVEREESGSFLVRTTRAEYRAPRLLFAVGGMSHPRRLNVPGEELPKVHYRFVEPYPYVRKDALVVGGGNSAAEAALFLAEEGARTTLAIWRSDWENRDPKMNSIKHWVRTPLEAEIEGAACASSSSPKSRRSAKASSGSNETTARQFDCRTTWSSSSPGAAPTLRCCGRPASKSCATRSWARFPFTIPRLSRPTSPASTSPATSRARATSRKPSPSRAASSP